jgi:hypothetical protein
MNIDLCLSTASAERCRGGEVANAAVERREAPHPYVTGVHAPSPRRVADRATVRRALAEAPGASRRAPCPSSARETEKGERATPGARKLK